MAPNHRSRQTSYTALHQQEAGYPVRAPLVPEAQEMDRSDSGYHSIATTRPGPCFEDPIPEESLGDNYDCDALASTDWQDSSGQQQMFSNYIVGGTGSQMLDRFPDDYTPRTAAPMSDVLFAPHQHQPMDLDSYDNTYLNEEQTGSHWADQFGSQDWHEMYDDHAPSSTMVPTVTEAEGASTTYQDMAMDTASQSQSTTSRRRLPNNKRHTSTTPTDEQQLNLTSTSMTTTATNKFPCLAPGCSKQFNRVADLDRHQKFIHCKDSVKTMLCDYRRCPRHRNPFHRPDHFRDHLRDQHKEDILKRGDAGNIDREWWLSRTPTVVYGGWWRCSKCFARVVVEKDAWQCPDPSCRNYCEQERQAARKLPIECDLYAECYTREEREKFFSPADFREHLRQEHKEDVPKNEGKDGAAELADPDWWATRDATVVYSPIWRCTRCLDAVDAERHGIECPRCGFECEETRRQYHGGFMGSGEV